MPSHVSSLSQAHGSPAELLKMRGLLSPSARTANGEPSRQRQRPNPNTTATINSDDANPNEILRNNLPGHRRFYSQQGALPAYDPSYPVHISHTSSSMDPQVPSHTRVGEGRDFEQQPNIIDNDPPQSHSQPIQSDQSQQQTKQRSRSQNAMMERDAIETLLFLSSPGNSQPSRPGDSSSRDNSQTATTVVPSSSRLGRVVQDSSGDIPGARPGEDEIDRMLDQLDDDESDDDR